MKWLHPKTPKSEISKPKTLAAKKKFRPNFEFLSFRKKQN